MGLEPVIAVTRSSHSLLTSRASRHAWGSLPSRCAADELAGCQPASKYFRALLEQHLYWERVWQREGRMELRLPGGRDDTDGGLLRDQAVHALLQRGLDLYGMRESTTSGNVMWQASAGHNDGQPRDLNASSPLLLLCRHA